MEEQGSNDTLWPASCCIGVNFCYLVTAAVADFPRVLSALCSRLIGKLGQDFFLSAFSIVAVRFRRSLHALGRTANLSKIVSAATSRPKRSPRPKELLRAVPSYSGQ